MDRLIRNDKEADDLNEYKKQNKKRMLSSLIVFAVIVIFVTISGLFNNNASIVSQVGDELIGISGSEESFFIYFDDISAVEMIDNLDPGTLLTGKSTNTVYTGTYRNDTYGEYQLYAYKTPGVFIVIHYTDGVFVFNGYSEGTTEDIYQNLMTAIEEYTKTKS